VVAVDNVDRTLLPGMTANAEIEVSRRNGVLRVPNAALRYKPPAEETEGAAPAAQPARGSAQLAADLPAIAQRLRLDARQRAAFDSAMAAMRARVAERSRTAASTPRTSQGLFGGPTPARTGGGASGGNQGAMRQRMLERLNQQFAAFRATLTQQQQLRWEQDIAALASARRAPIYLLVDGKPRQVVVRVGASDGTDTEVSGDIRAGDKVIVGNARETAPP
jgi:HlyD family secretion protein